MSARSGGEPLWWVRPIVEDVIREDQGTPFAGTHAAMVEHIARLHRRTGVQYAATELKSPEARS
ncbi:hypothetical protein [Reyranella sp.]|uniref:hypothetical protein n=1 Tax=Reyranella sp. TaxID=1929291 RepID=UPI003C7A15B7